MSDSNNHEVDLLEYYYTLSRNRVFIVCFTFIITLGGTVYSLCLPRVYEATAIIMPISGSRLAMESNSNISPMVGLLGGLANSGTQKLLSLLKSRALSRKVINELDLMPLLFPDQWNLKEKAWKNLDETKQPKISDGITALLGHLKPSLDTSGQLLNITVESEDPYLAVKIANAYAKYLQDFINENNLSLAKRDVQFVQEQVKLNKRNLLETSKEIVKYYSNNQISNIQSIVDVDVNLNMGQPYQQYSSPIQDNANIGKSSNESQENQAIVKDVPAQSYLDYLMYYRQSLSSLDASLTQQYFLARMNEGKEDLDFQVLDPAEPQLIPVEPRKKKIVLLTFIGSVMMSLFISAAREYVKKIRESH